MIFVRKTIFLVFVFILLFLAFSDAAYSSCETGSDTSITQYGITWTFDSEYQCGQFVNGDFWVLGPVTIVNIDPSSGDDGTGRIVNGSMIDPEASTNYQGFDSDAWDYDGSLNVALDISSSSPLIIQPVSSLVSSISLFPPESKKSIDYQAILTVVSSIPDAESFRPPWTETDKTMPYTYSDINTNFLRNLAPVDNQPSWEDIQESILPPFIGFSYSYWVGQNAARFGSVGLSDYGREISADMGAAALMINTDAPLSEKKMTIAALVQRGIDEYALYRASRIENDRIFMWYNDGGIKQGRKLPILLAGVLLNDADMSNIGFVEEPFHDDAQTFYVTQESIDITNSDSWDPDTRAYTQPYDASMIGMPEWGIRHSTRPEADNADWTAMYRQCCNAITNEATALVLLVMGLKELWNDDSYFDYQHRYMEIEQGRPDPFGFEVNNQPASPGWTAGSYGPFGWWRTAMYWEYWDDYYSMDSWYDKFQDQNETDDPSCIESWSCTEWSDCTVGMITRTCIDENDCGTEIEKPVEEDYCFEGYDFYDTFTGSSVDSSKWRVATWTEHGGRTGTERAYVEDDVINLIFEYDLNYYADTGNYLSSAIQSVREDFLYGRWEARLKPSNLSGVLNSMFTIDWRDNGGMTLQEIDIEFLTQSFGGGNGEVHIALHARDYPSFQSNPDIELGFDPSEEFHVWGFDITPEYIEWFVDDTILYTYYYQENDITVDAPYMMKFNSWSSEHWVGGPPEPDTESIYQIDWVRFKQYENECAVADDCPFVECSDPSQTTCDGGNCVYVPYADGTTCTDDGLFCNGNETCQSGSCTSSGNPCTADTISCTRTCDESTDTCNVPDDSLCTLSSGCTSASCDTQFGCIYVPDGCNDVSGMISRWEFETDASDSYGNNDGSMISGATITTDHEQGNVLHLDGSSHVDIPYSNSLDITAQITISLWVNVQSSGSYPKLFVKQYQDPSSDPWELYAIDLGSDGRTPRFMITDGVPSGHSVYLNGGVIPLDEWHHLLGTYDGSNASLYVDGILADSELASFSIGSNNMPIVMGANNFEGHIDDVRLFNRALTQQEISSLAGTAYIHPADINSNRIMEFTELNSYVQQWKTSPLISLAQLVEAIELWKGG
ncbi:MAG: LamG-like jellyroll fold domain-containing protein [Candidatus Woesearchaeota archaeon]